MIAPRNKTSMYMGYYFVSGVGKFVRRIVIRLGLHSNCERDAATTFNVEIIRCDWRGDGFLPIDF